MIRSVTRSFVLFLPLSMFACAHIEKEISGVVAEERSRDTALAASTGEEAKVPQDRYLAFRGKKAIGQGFVLAPCDLWAPFRWEAAGGLYDPTFAAQANGAVFATELDRRGPLPPTEFYGLGVQVTGGGLNVYGYAHTSGTALGSLFFPGAMEVELALEADGTTLHFLAREPGDPTYQTITTLPFANQQNPLNPGIGTFNLPKKGVVGFDRFRVAANGPVPG